MGLELVKKAQALKFQGGNTPSTLVPGVVPKTIYSLTIINSNWMNNADVVFFCWKDHP